MSGGTFWIDHHCIRLPFHGDGDRQELYYHLDGKEWWNKELRLISPYLGQGGVVVDVGANLGFMSGIFSNLTGATGQVYSFEPSPFTYAKLLEVIQGNQYANVLPYNLGCGREERTMTLFRPSSSGNATLRPDAGIEQSVRQKDSVRIVNLDEFVGPKLERLDFFKIDTEGFEDEVLAGASGILQRFKPVIYIELSSQYRAASERAIELLHSHRYKFEDELSLESSFLGDNFFAFPPGFQSSR